MRDDPDIPRFRQLTEGPSVEIIFEGTRLTVPKGISLAAALLLHGLPAGRIGALSGSQRCAYCLIGQCFDCTMTIDGVPYRQACLTPVSEGMTAERQVA